MSVIYIKVKCLKTLVLFSSINGPARFCFSHCVHNISVPVYGPRFQNSVIFLAQEAQIDGYVGSRPRELNTSVAISKKKKHKKEWANKDFFNHLYHPPRGGATCIFY
jgi:hypothetical protein